MLLTEWNWDDARAVWEEEALQKGLQQGIQQVIKQLLARGMSKEQVAQMTGIDVNDLEN